MKGALQFIAKDAEHIGRVESRTMRGINHIVWKSKTDKKWHCSCPAGLMGGNCSHIKKMAEKFGEGDKCFYCGTTRWAAGGLEKNHVEMRGVRPDLTFDPKNIMILCRRDHERFHSDQEFKENLQELWRRKMKT